MQEDEGRKQIKLKKEKSKKSNVEPTLLLAQNTNVFSQLSANYLQTKVNISQEEKTFLENTEIIQYHDPNINRMIGLLRKKAEVTKVKAIVELRDYIKGMDADQIEPFMSTFTYLFREIILSEDSKQILDEMCHILTFFLENHKKFVIPNIAAIYPAILIAQKITNFKFFPLLFGGDASAHAEKSLVLLLKPEVSKQFMIVSRIVIDNDDATKLSQPIFIRNCYGLLRAFKELIHNYAALSEAQSQKISTLWTQLYGKFVKLSDSAGAKKYLKEESRAKAVFLEIFVQYLIVETTNRIPTDIQSLYLVNHVMDNFLTKDISVQTSLWKYCNTPMISILNSLKLNNLLNKYDTKLFDVLKVGGVAMLKELPNYVKVFPFTALTNKNVNDLNNTINYIRKFNEALLDLDEENQFRLQCYGDLNVYFINQYHELRAKFPSDTADEKENKRREQLRKLTEKAEREAVQSLQERYYKSPPVSRNSMTFYVPQQFERLLRVMDLQPNMRFVSPHTYALYKGVANEQKFQSIINKIFEGLKTTEELLEYFENFPARPVSIQMKGGELRQIYQRCRIFHFTLQFQKFNWFEWEHYYNIFMFDPLLQPHHIQEIADKIKPTFNQKLFPKASEDQYNDKRIEFVLSMLKSREPKVRFFLPSLVELLKREKHVSWEPFIEIETQDMKELASGPHTQIIKNVEALYDIILGYLSEKKESDQNINTFLSNYFEFVFYTDEYKMYNVSTELIKKAKQLRDHPQFEFVLQSMKSCIGKRVLSLAKAGVDIEERKQKNLKNKTTAALSLFRVLNQFLVSLRNREMVISISEELLLPIYLQYALFRIEIWQLLHVFLEELEDDEFKLILKVTLSKNNYTCLRLLSSVSYLYPLQNHLDLKRFYVQICSTLVKPMILDELEEQNTNILPFLKSMADHSIEESLIFSVGLRGVIKQLVLQCGDNEILETLFDICVKDLVKRLFTQEDVNKTMRVSITVKNILPEFGELLSEKCGKDLFQQALETINKVLSEKKLSETIWRVRLEAAVDIVSIYWSQAVQTDLIFDDKAFPLSELITSLMEAMHEQFININYEMQVLLNFANTVIEKKTLEPFSDQLVKLENMVMKLMNFNFKTASKHTEETKFSSDSLVKLCQFLRKILPVVEAFRTEFKPLLIQNILDLCNAKVEDYKLVSDEVDAGVVDQNVETVVVEFSELIARFSLVISADLDEELVVNLLGCVFPQIQKSAFILLRQYYELGFAKGVPPPAYLSRLQSNMDPEASTLVFSQLLMWSAFFLRKLCTDKDRKQDNEEGQDIFDSNKLADIYLSFVFATIESLDYEATLPSFTLQPQQVWEVSPDWSNFLTKEEVLKLAVQSLFIFADSFPMSLRLWVGGLKDKTMKGLCEVVIRDLVSEALFLKEVEKIELRQPEWKSQNFDVYASKRSREISAEYKKQNASVSLKLKIKADYPISTIVIEFANELKIEQQLNKWAVRLRSILYNQNNSIVSAILLWKQNIDKEFEGVEQCAICYDIVNAVKQLPRMVCKTCKKKFHAACIRKWFTTSNKSECPLCKSQFL